MKKYIQVLSYSIKLLWKASKYYFCFTLLTNIALGIPSIISIFIWRNILNETIFLLQNRNGNYITIINLILINFALTIISNLLGKLSNFIKQIYNYKIDKYITETTLRIVSSIKFELFDFSDIYNDIEKSNMETASRSINILNSFTDSISRVMNMITSMGILWLFSFYVMIIALISTIPGIILALYSSKTVYNTYNDRFEKLRYVHYLKMICTQYENLKELRLFSGIRYIQMKINKIFDDVIITEKRIQKKILSKALISDIIELLVLLITQIYVILTGIKRRLKIGDLNMYLESIVQLNQSFYSFIMTLLEIYENCLYLEGFFNLSTLEKENPSKSKKHIENTDFIINEVELKEVYFKYPGTSSYVLENINLKLTKGKTYTLVGENGSGKSTLIKIILGLYKPDKGAVLINGKNLSDYDYFKYLSKITAVFQDFIKYPLTVRENIGIGWVDKIDDFNSVVSASIDANVHSFIDKYSNKYEEKLLKGWENSVDISGGQWQRIAIARALMRENSELLIFDEPTASLDAESEYQLIKRLLTFKRKKINFIITHRFNNMAKMNNIFVIENGKITESGTHNDILVKSKTYRRLYERQSCFFENSIS